MDKRFLDPRRPITAKPTPAEQEEGLIPFSDSLPLFTAMHTTYNRQVAQLQSVVVAPSQLESTCLVFAHGSDLFFTRLVPARHFDSLETDFSYALLVVGLLALGVGTAMARVYSQKAMLKHKWQ